MEAKLLFGFFFYLILERETGKYKGRKGQREEGAQGGRDTGREGHREGGTQGGREGKQNLLFHLFMHSLIDSCMCLNGRSNLQTWQKLIIWGKTVLALCTLSHILQDT